jgi:heme/copper-type cytochrome/quinol oxidase subunit 4
MFILSITLSVIGFSLISAGDLKTYKNSDFILCLIQVSFTAVGSLISEMTFKYMNYPFCTQMAQSRLFSFMTSLAFLFFYCNVNKCFHLVAFHGWNYRIFLLTFWLMVRDWIQTFTIKLLSALWKALASAVSLCLTYFIQVNFQGKPSSPVLTIFTLIVVIDVIGYSLSRMSVPSTETKKENN